MNSYYKGNAKVVSRLSVLRYWIDRGALYKLRNSGEEPVGGRFGSWF